MGSPTPQPRYHFIELRKRGNLFKTAPGPLRGPGRNARYWIVFRNLWGDGKYELEWGLVCGVTLGERFDWEMVEGGVGRLWGWVLGEGNSFGYAFGCVQKRRRSW